jgi:RNA polymerase sigma-70 factor (ECF subfamily)
MISGVKAMPRDQARPPESAGIAGPTLGDTVDAALMARIAAGDKSAMRVLYTRHHARIFRFILQFIADTAVAEEVLQEVFLDVWRKAHMFEGRSRVSTWLLGVARHKALQARRSRPHVSLDDGVAELVEDPADNAEAVAEKRDTATILRNCLAQLSPVQREIIELIYLRGKTINDAAATIGAAQNTVKTRMFYARKRLAELLRSQGITALPAV